MKNKFSWAAGTGARQRSDRAPGLLSGELEFALCPISERRNRWRCSNQAEIQFGIIYRRLAGITFRQKLQHDSISKIARERNVRLQRDALALGTRQQIAQSRDGRI